MTERNLLMLDFKIMCALQSQPRTGLEISKMLKTNARKIYHSINSFKSKRLIDSAGMRYDLKGRGRKLYKITITGIDYIISEFDSFKKLLGGDLEKYLIN